MKKMKRVNEPDLCHISDHALLRWLERVHGIDVEFFRQKLLDETRDYIAVGATTIKRDGATYIIKDGILVTVIG